MIRQAGRKVGQLAIRLAFQDVETGLEVGELAAREVVQPLHLGL